MPTSLGDGSLYTEEQLRSMEQARTRVRLHVETQADGTLKGYGYNTQARRDWEMIPVVTFQTRGEQQVADFGDGVELIWTPAVDPSATLGIPALEAAPRLRTSGFFRRHLRRTASSSTRSIRRSTRISFWCFRRILGFRRCMLFSTFGAKDCPRWGMNIIQRQKHMN